MEPDETDAEVVGSPASHWGTADPTAQPSRDMVAGVRRVIQEIKTRLGPTATSGAVWAELQARGMKIDRAEVERCFADPYP